MARKKLKLKFRFIRMMDWYSPLMRSQMSRKALSQLGIKSPEFKRLLAGCLNDKLLESKRTITEKKGTNPEIFSITAKGKKWLKAEQKKIDDEWEGVK